MTDYIMTLAMRRSYIAKLTRLTDDPRVDQDLRDRAERSLVNQKAILKRQLSKLH